MQVDVEAGLAQRRRREVGWDPRNAAPRAPSSVGSLSQRGGTSRIAQDVFQALSSRRAAIASGRALSHQGGDDDSVQRGERVLELGRDRADLDMAVLTQRYLQREQTRRQERGDQERRARRMRSADAAGSSADSAFGDEPPKMESQQQRRRR